MFETKRKVVHMIVSHCEFLIIISNFHKLYPGPTSRPKQLNASLNCSGLPQDFFSPNIGLVYI